MAADRIRWFYLFAFLASAGLFVLAVYRAYYIPVTHDEALSWFYADGRPVFDITGYVGTNGVPNNHILNSLLFKFTTWVFGNSPLTLRLPNILFLVLYLYSAARLSALGKTIWISIAAFALLCFNPYLFDFSHLARGYGMANALLLYTVYRLHCWYQRRTTLNAALIFISAALMVLSNFTTLHVFFAFIAVYLGIYLYHDQPFSMRKFFRAMKVPGTAIVLLGIVLYEPFRTIIKWKTTYGGTTGFWQDCAVNVIISSCDGAPYAGLFHSYTPLVVMAVTALVTLFAAYQVIKRNYGKLIPALALFWIPILLFQLQHIVMGTEFPVARAVQFIYPLFILPLCAAFDQWNPSKSVLHYAFAIAGLTMPFHFITTAQTTYINEWKYDADNRQVLNDVDSIARAQNVTAPIHLVITWIYEPGLNYEIQQRSDGRFTPVTRHEDLNAPCDYFYAADWDAKYLDKVGDTLVKYYPTSGGALYRRSDRTP